MSTTGEVVLDARARHATDPSCKEDINVHNSDCAHLNASMLLTWALETASCSQPVHEVAGGRFTFELSDLDPKAQHRTAMRRHLHALCVALVDCEGDAPRRAVADYITKLEPGMVQAACDLAAVWFGVDLAARWVEAGVGGRCVAAPSAVSVPASLAGRPPTKAHRVPLAAPHAAPIYLELELCWVFAPNFYLPPRPGWGECVAVRLVCGGCPPTAPLNSAPSCPPPPSPPAPSPHCTLRLPPTATPSGRSRLPSDVDVDTESAEACTLRLDLLQGLTTLFFALGQPETTDAVGAARETVGTLASLLLGRFDGDATLVAALQATLDEVVAASFRPPVVAAGPASPALHPTALHFVILMAATVGVGWAFSTAMPFAVYRGGLVLSGWGVWVVWGCVCGQGGTVPGLAGETCCPQRS